jgi:hypothetical protein
MGNGESRSFLRRDQRQDNQKINPGNLHCKSALFFFCIFFPITASQLNSGWFCTNKRKQPSLVDNSPNFAIKSLIRNKTYAQNERNIFACEAESKFRPFSGIYIRRNEAARYSDSKGCFTCSHKAVSSDAYASERAKRPGLINWR